MLVINCIYFSYNYLLAFILGIFLDEGKKMLEDWFGTS